MKSWKKLNLLSLSLLMACSTAPHKVAHQTTDVARSIASIDANRRELSPTHIKKTIKGIFHSYLLGQVLLQEFDQMLDHNASLALDSESYHKLQAIRILVDGFEEHLNAMYLELVMISALPKFSDQQKSNARSALNLIGDFLNGIMTDKKELPENLKPLILGNLRDKQTHLFDQLQTINQDSSITQNDPEVISEIHKNMVLLRATRMKMYRDIKNYKVDQKLLRKVVKEQSKDRDFINYKTIMLKIAQEIKDLIKDLRGGRSTSSDVIFASTGAQGNITGRGFPANTWSLTYDDGPGSKTTPVVLKNLIDRKLKATFFVLAKQVEGLPNTAKSLVDADMDIASHSYDHVQLTKVSGASLDKQISGSKKIIETKLGKQIKLFRLPYGAGVSNTTIRSKIAASGMIHVFWNVDTLDWQDKNPTSIFNRSLKQMNASAKNSGVILFHDIHQQSVVASAMLMDHMIKNKIKVCTVQAVVDQLNKGLPECQQ